MKNLVYVLNILLSALSKQESRTLHNWSKWAPIHRGEGKAPLDGSVGGTSPWCLNLGSTWAPGESNSLLWSEKVEQWVHCCSLGLCQGIWLGQKGRSRTMHLSLVTCESIGRQASQPSGLLVSWRDHLQSCGRWYFRHHWAVTGSIVPWYDSPLRIAACSQAQGGGGTVLYVSAQAMTLLCVLVFGRHYYPTKCHPLSA